MVNLIVLARGGYSRWGRVSALMMLSTQHRAIQFVALGSGLARARNCADHKGRGHSSDRRTSIHLPKDVDAQCFTGERKRDKSYWVGGGPSAIGKSPGGRHRFGNHRDFEAQVVARLRGAV